MQNKKILVVGRGLSNSFSGEIIKQISIVLDVPIDVVYDTIQNSTSTESIKNLINEYNNLIEEPIRKKRIKRRKFKSYMGQSYEQVSKKK